jgi:hypothetical protein
MHTLILGIFLAAAMLQAGESGTIVSARAPGEFPLTADPLAAHWQGVKGVAASKDARGEPTPGHHTEIRSRWTDKYLYLLFICEYEELNLKPDPDTKRETAELWNWDVAEVFIGADFGTIQRYREFQVSPQGELLDLDIDSRDLNADRDMQWNSGFEVKARIDRARRVWHGEMKIPLAAIDERHAAAGNQLRVNFYRLQGPRSNRRQIAWRPTGTGSHHVPESFGRLVLGD